MKRSVTRLFTVTFDVGTSTAFTCALLLAASVHTAGAAGVVGTGTAASCTEQAFDAAARGGGLVTFNCGGPATITFTSQKQVQSNDITIDGGGVITISGGNSVSIAIVANLAKLTVQNLTFVDGTGGALYNNHGTLTVINCTFSGNSGAIFNNYAATLTTVTNSTFSGNSGGAISNEAPLTVTNSTFSGNSGSAISASSSSNPGTLTITNSTFSSNKGTAINSFGGTVTNSTFSGNGGAIFNSNGDPLTIADSTFSGNTAKGVGAISNGGTLTVTNSTFSGNTATGSVNGIGAISNSGTLTVINSTFSGNTATSYNGVGAISNGGTLTVINSTFSGNPGSGSYSSSIHNSGTLTLTNTIVANTTNGANCSGTITDGGHNLDDGATCGFTANGSLSNTNPLLDSGGLASNGGPTQTIALQTGSPAINAGDESVCSAPPVSNLDQRGYVRPGAGATSCSIGAYEDNAVPASPNPTPTPSTSTCIGDCNGDGSVTVDEILTMVNIALGTAQTTACPDGVPSGDEVNISLILQAVNNALNGCGGG
ncbi:MAG: right-handed parallel beta-helix repeat-containing protein [Candidatus Binatia bacterium]|jgi:hypothetical protein